MDEVYKFRSIMLGSGMEFMHRYVFPLRGLPVKRGSWSRSSGASADATMAGRASARAVVVV